MGPRNLVPPLVPTLLALGAAASATAQDRIDFNRDIRPILERKCADCHDSDAEAPWYAALPEPFDFVARDIEFGRQRLELAPSGSLGSLDAIGQLIGLRTALLDDSAVSDPLVTEYGAMRHLLKFDTTAETPGPVPLASLTMIEPTDKTLSRGTWRVKSRACRCRMPSIRSTSRPRRPPS